MSLSILHHADVFDILPTIPDGSIDLLFHDLPYNTTDCDWEHEVDLKRLWPEWLRIAKSNAAFVFTSAQPFTTDLINSQRQLYRYDLVWNKVGLTGYMNANKMPMRLHEDILIFYRELPTFNPQKRQAKPYTKHRDRNKVVEVYSKPRDQPTVSDGLMNPTSILEFPKPSCIGSNAERKANAIHPTQKPVDLLRWIIRTYSNPGETVFDGYAGSFTTSVAAELEGRKSISVEKQERYYTPGYQRVIRLQQNPQLNLTTY